MVVLGIAEVGVGQECSYHREEQPGGDLDGVVEFGSVGARAFRECRNRFHRAQEMDRGSRGICWTIPLRVSSRCSIRSIAPSSGITFGYHGPCPGRGHGRDLAWWRFGAGSGVGGSR